MASWAKIHTVRSRNAKTRTVTMACGLIGYLRRMDDDVNTSSTFETQSGVDLHTDDSPTCARCRRFLSSTEERKTVP